ncbi:uncharacterized protein TNCV_4754141 [Trichonephila clavipes]|nr:uncharacterized protein TNCV_4754141 [Trichonephila clavipes]
MRLNENYTFEGAKDRCEDLASVRCVSSLQNVPVRGSKKFKLGFVEWAQNEIAVVPDFHKRILFSDEAHFWLNGYVNKQNCRIWSEANPQVYVKTPLYPEKLTVWCALWAGGIIGPYFFKNDEGHNVTVNGDRYRAMITNFFIPELNNHDVQELWFQQDGVAAVAEWYRHRIVAGFVTSSSPVPLKTRRVGQRCTLNLSRAETSSRWCGVVVRRGGASSGVVHVT